MMRLIFLCILANIYFIYAEKEESSAYYDLLSKAISRPQIYDDEYNEIIKTFQQIWDPKLLFEFARHGKIKQEINPEVMQANNLYLSKDINDPSFVNSDILPSINVSSEKSFRASSSDFTNSSLTPSSSAVYTQNSSYPTTIYSTTSNFSSPVTYSRPFSIGSSIASSGSLTTSTTVYSTTSNSSSPVTSQNSSSFSTGSSIKSSASLATSTTVYSTTSNVSSPNSSSFSTTSFPITNYSSPVTVISTNQPTPSTTLSPEAVCLTDLVDIGFALTQSKKYKWALQMLDSVGKPSSGILQGSVNWFGSYEECFVKVPADQRPDKDLNSLEGIYCLATFSNSKNQTPVIPNPYSLSFAIKEALCVPSSCSANILKDVLDLTLNKIINQVPQLANLSVDAVTCPPRSQNFDSRAIGVLFLLSVFLLLMFLGTLYDVIIHRNLLRLTFKSYHKLNDDTAENNEIIVKPGIVENGLIHNDNNFPMIHQPGIIANILLAFSVYTNGAKILNVDQADDSLNCIHGIRFLSISWVILGHTYVYGATNFSDIMRFGDFANGFLFQAIENAFVSVDSFFLLSGTLVTYTFMKMYEAGKVSWLAYYLHRFWRLTPAYMLILGTYIALIKYFGNGPLWANDGVEVNYCADSWWYNLLYINNFISMKIGCMGWSWYLANDMQFYVISPAILILLVKKKEFGFFLIGLFMIATWISSGVISSVYNLPTASFFDLSRLMDYMDKFYIKPYCRIGPYLVGIMLGYILYITKCQYHFKNKWIPLLCWAVAIAMNMAIVYGLVNSGFDNHPLSKPVNALYNSLNRTGWAVGLGWVIFACLTGYGGFVNTILSWKFWIPLSRLSYCAYLVHPIMMYFFYLNQKYLFKFSQYLMVYLFLAHLTISFAAAFVLSLAFESPMMGLEKVLLSRNKKNPKE